MKLSARNQRKATLTDSKTDAMTSYVMVAVE